MTGPVQRCGPVLIADADPAARGFLVRLLESVGVVAHEAASREDALATARREQPRLVIVDVGLPPLSGYELCRELKAEFGEIAVVFVSDDRVEPRDRVAGLYLGGDDYVVKPFDPGELLARVTRLLPAVDRSEAAPSLTPREHEVLTLLARGASQPAIARELVISPKTVGNHIQNVLKKLGAHSRAEAVAMAYRRGLVREPA